MNGDRSDASTSTDDVKDRPLCLFYFTHPFGVVSPEAPTVRAVPAGLARAFFNMEPVPPYRWPPPPSPGACAAPRPAAVARARRCTLELPPTAASWLPHRAPHARILPPLRLPSPPDLADRSSDDAWPRRCLNRFSLPPIELPVEPRASAAPARGGRREEPSGAESACSGREARGGRGLGVRKPRRRGRGRRRARGTDVRRMLACLMRRVLNESGSVSECGASPAPALQRALGTVRHAWRQPVSLLRRCRGLSHMHVHNKALERESSERDSERESDAGAMLTHAGPAAAAGGQRRPDASPGLMRRRYSVPETIMRKYRLAQRNSDSEESGARQGASTACPSPRSGDESPSPRHPRPDRELMRKSALLRRMWARPPPTSPPACGCERGSRDELRRPAPRSPDRCDSTTLPDPSTCRETTDALSLGSPAEPPTGRASPTSPRAPLERSDPFSASASFSTAKETPCSGERPRSDFATSDDHPDFGSESAPRGENDVRHAPRTLPDDAAVSFEVLEICVSESRTATPPEGGVQRGRDPRLCDADIDEYVSRVLVESLASLSDRLEGVGGAGAGDRRLSVVGKEIKVRLQNAGVNTIVHLSPTSNNQIIFGNEELCNDDYARDRAVTRDECNNPLALVFCDVRDRDDDRASPPSRTEAFDAVLQHDRVNRAVLHQIQQLFRDEMRHAASEDSVSHAEVSNVDAFLDSVGGVGAGNYYRDAAGGTLVPRPSAFPCSVSMEVNTSSEEADADVLGSDCASLVDSLDDPNSPRGAGTVLRPRRRPELVRSALDVLELLPEDARPREGAASREPAEAFFVGIRDDDAAPAPDAERARVAEYMPERIRQKLHRRQRKRELRMECARRGKVRQLREELERRRRDERERARRDAERHAAALVEALVDDVVAKIARQEYGDARRARNNPRFNLTKSEENLDRRYGRRESDKISDIYGKSRHDSIRRRSDDGGRPARRPDRHHVHGRLLARPCVLSAEGAPRRIYQKSEIREGDKCIEILEILEYATAPRSPDSAPSDEGEHSARARRSRIPVPTRADHMRLTGGAPAPALAPPESRYRSDSLRFKRIFDMIPEERSSISLDSSVDAEDAENAPRASAPKPADPLRPASTRSSGTSPPAAVPARTLRTQTTMTSPHSKSAATSPLRSPRPPRPPRPPREGPGERCEPMRRTTPTATPTRHERESHAARRRGRVGEGGLRDEAADSSDGGSGSSGSSGSLLCSLAPRWLSAHARPRRRRVARPSDPHPLVEPPPPASPLPTDAGATGGWSVTVAGSCRAALPADVEMRLRFPGERRRAARSPPPAPPHRRHQECACAACAPPALPPAAPPAPRATSRQDRLTLTMKKEAQDSSLVATKSVAKGSEPLPQLETYRTSRTKLKSSVKMRRGCSLHCWLPDDESATAGANNGLSVLGCAIIPELKPRVPTMSERDLTRVYTPRHYLRS